MSNYNIENIPINWLMSGNSNFEEELKSKDIVLVDRKRKDLMSGESLSFLELTYNDEKRLWAIHL